MIGTKLRLGTKREQTLLYSEVVQDGDTTALDLTGKSLISARIRWVGVNRTETETSTNINTSATASLPSGSEFSMTHPSVPSGYNFSYHGYIIRVRSTDGNSVTGVANFLSPVNIERTRTTTSTSFQGSPLATRTTNRVGSSLNVAITGEGNGQAEAWIYTAGEKSIIFRTKDPKATINGQTNQYIGELGNGVSSPWQELTSLTQNTTNNISHQSSGSNRARIEIEYTVR